MTTTQSTTYDITADETASFAVLTCLTTKAQEWLRENADTEDWQWLGAQLVVDLHYADDLYFACLDAGLSIEGMDLVKDIL